MSQKFQESMSLAKPESPDLSVKEKVSVFIGLTGLFIFYEDTIRIKDCIPVAYLLSYPPHNYPLHKPAGKIGKEKG